MEERKEELNFIVNMIYNMCVKYEVALIPCETKKGTKYVGILDNTTGKTYAMINGEKD